MSDSFSFWLGLGLSVPIAIAVNLLTPHLQRRLAKRSASSRRRLAEGEDARRQTSAWFADNPLALVAILQFYGIRMLQRFCIGAVILLLILMLVALVPPDSPSTASKATVGALLLLGLLITLYLWISGMNNAGEYDRIYYPAAERAKWIFPTMSNTLRNELLARYGTGEISKDEQGPPPSEAGGIAVAPADRRTTPDRFDAATAPAGP